MTPRGLQLEHPASGGVRVLLRLSARSRALLLLPRLALIASAVAGMVLAWRSRVYVAFWVFGLPLVRWLFGQGQLSLLIGERALEPGGTRLFRPPLSLPRSQIQAIEIGRGGPFQLFQRAIVVRTKAGQATRLLVGVSPAQAKFVNDGLQRWLVDEN